MHTKLLSVAVLIGSIVGINSATAQNAEQTPPPAKRPSRPAPPARDPNTPGYVTAKELPDGEMPPANADGNFIIGPTHKPAPEMKVQDGVPHGTIKTSR